MRLIDADEIRWADHYDSDGNLSKYKVAYSDEMPPTVDAVPVIRCKDCKYWLGNNHWCCFDMNTVADDYCSKGTRRTK